MDNKELILATKPFTKENRFKSYALSLTTLILLVSVFYGAIVIDIALIKLTLGVIAALLMMRMFVIYHDYEHHAILYKSVPAKIIFTLYGLFMLAPASIWKRSHDYHHKHNSKMFTANIGSYPLMTKEQFLNATESERKAYLWSRHPLNMLLGYFTFFIYGMCIQSLRSNFSKHWDSLLALVLHVTLNIVVIYHYGLSTWFFAMFIPFFICLMIGAYLFYVQHNFPGVKFNDKKHWEYTEAALKSSSYLKMNRVMQWFSANIGFHHIHHLNSRIPFYRLPETMMAFKELQNPVISTLKIKDIVACLKLKLWDPEQNRMLTLNEVKFS